VRNWATSRPWFSFPRLALLAVLALCWLNYLLTSRWAGVAGALHGAKSVWFVAALAMTTGLAVVAPVGGAVRLGRSAMVAGFGGVAFLAFAFLAWFPPDTWNKIPFLDNWPARYQSTIDQIALFRRGAVVGWQWAFLGGYHLSSDLTVTHAALAWIPISLFGGELGFHVLHAALFAAIPLLVWLDLRTDANPELKWVAMGLAAVLAASYSYGLIGAGDTNSIAGVVTTFAALLAARLMRQSRWGGPLLVLALALVLYAHAGFLLFVGCYLAIQVLLERDWRHAVGIGIAFVAAMVVALPLTWESLAFGAYFTPNNAVLEQPPFQWREFTRGIYYNVELLALPGRWVNDYRGLANVLLPILVFAAVRARGRARFYACASLATIAITRLYVPQYLGWGMIRAAHMQPMFMAPVIAWFILTCCARRPLALALLFTIALYIQVSFASVPHVSTLRDFDAALIDRVASARGALVLVENSYHPEMDGDPSTLMERTPFGAHFEALLPPSSGRRFYAGVWDGWQWAPARRNLLANGALGGRRLDWIEDGELVDELRRWGVSDLFVWSRMAIQRLSGSDAFTEQWQHGRWRLFRVREPDFRSVVSASGAGDLRGLDPLSAEVHLTSVHAGDLVVVRTNFYPAWQIRYGGERVPIVDVHGQLGFHAPSNGDYVVKLVYPRRPWLLALALAVGAGASAYLWRRGRYLHGATRT